MDDKNRKIIAGVGGLAALAGVLLFGRQTNADIPDEEPPPIDYPCPYCPEVFDTEAALYDHINMVHPELEPVPGEYIVYSNLRVIPQRVMLGGTVQVKVDVNNIGTESATVQVYLGPDSGLTKTVTVPPGDERTPTWNYKAPAVGYVTFTIGPLTQMLEVTEYEDPYQPPIEEDETVMAMMVPSGIMWTLKFTGPGTFEFGAPPEESHWVKHSGNHYRVASGSNLIDFHVESDGLHRDQLIGTSMVYPINAVLPPGDLWWYTYQALFNYMDAGCPNGWYNESIWSGKAFACRDGNSTSWMCEYFPAAV
ncbi:MAG: hypothetical protein PHW65_01605 [Dehalococcoidales bacterium]|nr:hypothetical protein [Dehalococcoidales bacterium]